MNSVANQDWDEVEHIVIDGASTDGTLELLKQHQSKFSHLLSTPDCGIYDAMNKGLKLASGEIICFLNADDFYVSKHVLSFVAKEMKERGLDALLGDVGFFNANNTNKIVRRYRSGRFSPEKLAWGWMPAHPSLFLHQGVVKRVGLFKINYKIAGDFDYIVRAFYRQNLRYHHVPEVLVMMQTGGVSTSGMLSKLVLNNEMLRACRESGISTNIIKILSRYPLKFLELLRK